MGYLKIQLSDTVSVLKLEFIKYSEFRGIVYLDRDGVLIEDYGYVGSVENVKVIEGSTRFLQECTKKNYIVAVITNQSGIGRGYYSWSDYYLVTNEMIRKISQSIKPHFIVACSKNPDDKSVLEDKYRKPQIGMIEYIRKEIGVKFDNEYLIGDKASDLKCGLNANIKSISHVLTGHGITEKEKVNILCRSFPNISIHEHVGRIELK